MKDKVLIGYSGSYAFGITTFHEMERLKEKLKKNPNNAKAKKEIAKIKKRRAEHVHPVYVSKKKYKKLKEFQELDYLSGFL